MRRLFLLVALTFAVVAHATAQSEASVWIRLSPDTLVGPHAKVRVIGLLDDPEWRDAVTKSFPVRLEWSVQLWQKGGVLGIGAKAGPRVTWKETIQWNSVLRVYQLTTEVPGQRIPPQQFASIDLLALQIGRATELVDFAPRNSGKWYYRLTLDLSTLTDEQLSGLDPSQQRGSAIAKAVNRVLLGWGLPSSRSLTQDSPEFRWR